MVCTRSLFVTKDRDNANLLPRLIVFIMRSSFTIFQCHIHKIPGRLTAPTSFLGDIGDARLSISNMGVLKGWVAGLVTPLADLPNQMTIIYAFPRWLVTLECHFVATCT